MMAGTKSEGTLRKHLSVIVPFVGHLFDNKKESLLPTVLWASRIRKNFDDYLDEYLKIETKAQLTTRLTDYKAALHRFQEFETSKYGDSLPKEDVILIRI